MTSEFEKEVTIMKEWTKPVMETLSIEETYEGGSTMTSVDNKVYAANGKLWTSWDDTNANS